MSETDLELDDGRTLHAYDRAPMTRTAGSPSSGTTARRTSVRLPSPFSRPRTGSASAGCPTTGQDTAGRPPPGPGRGVADALSIDRFAAMGWLREHADRD